MCWWLWWQHAIQASVIRLCRFSPLHFQVDRSTCACAAAAGIVEKRRADRQFEHLGPTLCDALDGEHCLGGLGLELGFITVQGFCGVGAGAGVLSRWL